MSISAIDVRNQFRGRIREIFEGPVVEQLDVETPSGQLVTPSTRHAQTKTLAWWSARK